MHEGAKVIKEWIMVESSTRQIVEAKPEPQPQYQKKSMTVIPSNTCRFNYAGSAIEAPDTKLPKPHTYTAIIVAHRAENVKVDARGATVASRAGLNLA